MTLISPVRSALVGVAAALMVLTSALAEQGGADEESAAYLSNIAVATDAEPDMSSVESILAAIIKPGMSDEEKAMAIWKFVHEHRFWAPSSAPVEHGKAVNDPVLIINCFPALICQQDASVVSAIWAGAGFDVRYWQMGTHTTSEVRYGGKWRNLDTTFGRITRGKDGTVADVTQWKSMYKPKVSSVTPWDDYEIGHRMNLCLRRGETFTRYWHPLSKDADYWRAGANRRMPQDHAGRRRGLDQTMSRKDYRFELKGGGFSSGLWVFKPDLADGRWREVFETADNVAVAGDPPAFVHATQPGTPGTLIYHVLSPYIITGGWLEGDFVLDAADAVQAFISTDNGATWKKLDGVRAGKVRLPLRRHVGGTLGYLVKLQMHSAEPAKAGVRDLCITTAVQLNPLSLPALTRGVNTVRLAAGEQTQTLTVIPDLTSAACRKYMVEQSNVTTARAQLQERWVFGLCAKEGGKPSHVVYKVTAPGEIRKVCWGGNLRSGPSDANEMYYSTDGKDWKKQEMSTRWTFPGSDTRNLYVAYNETTEGFPPGTKTVWLKYALRRPVPKHDRAALHLANALRIDVEFVPGGTGAVPPVEITYDWTEEASKRLAEKTHTEVIRALPHSYSITVGGDAKPIMRSIRMRLLGR